MSTRTKKKPSTRTKRNDHTRCRECGKFSNVSKVKDGDKEVSMCWACRKTIFGEVVK